MGLQRILHADLKGYSWFLLKEYAIHARRNAVPNWEVSSYLRSFSKLSSKESKMMSLVPDWSQLCFKSLGGLEVANFYTLSRVASQLKKNISNAKNGPN